MGSAAGEEIHGELEGGSKTVLTKGKMKESASKCDVLRTCMYGACVYAKRDPEMYQRQHGRSEERRSLCATGGSTGLVETHRFAQPAGKVHFLHF